MKTQLHAPKVATLANSATQPKVSLVFRGEWERFASRACSLCGHPSRMTVHVQPKDAATFYAFCTRCVKRMSVALGKTKR